MRITRSMRLLVILAVFQPVLLEADEPPARKDSGPRLTTAELAQWIDGRFAEAWKEAGVTPPDVVEDATYLKRTYLDLTGTIPTVSQAREFLDYSGEHKRITLVERLLTETKRPEKYSERTAAHWATLWRRMMVPGNTPEAQMAVGLEPWLKEQFASNVPYDEFARRVVTATSSAQAPMPAQLGLGVQATGPALFYQAVGGKPESAAGSVTRVFLGVRIGCAECHDHPFAEWKQKDFWGMAAFFAGVNNGTVGDVLQTKIKPQGKDDEYAAKFLGGAEAKLEKGKTPRETLANWMVDAANVQFAATAVNRVWQYLVGRGLTESVDDLDKASPAERQILDQLASLFIQAGYDVRWLIAGICQSQVYQRACVAVSEEGEAPLPGLRPVKTLTPEQLFNSIEQALALPVSRTDGSARFNGLRAQLIARMNEAAANNPDEFRAGIPQALLLMNGRLTAEATDLDQSRTLRGVLDAPFLDTDEKLSTLYLAAFSRRPHEHEQHFLLNHIHQQATEEQQRQAFAEIFWGLLNSPEFVLER